MITKLSHATIWVNNQDEALEFYTKKLGFDVRTDATMDGFRWVTVGSKNQPDLEIVLMEAKVGPMLDEKVVAMIKELMSKGAMGAGVFETDDCQKTYEDLKANGVEFIAPPAKRPYGIEALLKDNSGNWFSMTQHR